MASNTIISTQLSSTSDSSSNVYIMSIANTISSKQSLLIIPIVKFFNIPENLIYLIRVLNSEVFGTKTQKSGSPISLRLIDWFVTNYCKKNNIMYNIADYRKKDNIAETERPSSFENFFFVHDNYKSQLKECSKKHFDPFCRRNRVRFYYKPNAYFKTTVGQLNFFKWALEHHIIDYIREHLDEIEKDMNDSIIITPPVSVEKKIEKATKKRTTSESGSVAGANSGAGASNAVQATSSAAAAATAQINPILAELAPKTKSHKKTTSRQKRKELSSSANKSFTKYSIPTTLTFD